MPGRLNGSCYLNDDEWIEYRERADRVESVVKEIHSQNQTLVNHTAHLQKLDALSEIKDSLLSAAIGRTQLDLGIAKLIFWLMGAVMLGELFVIVFLLTGEKLGILQLLQHQ